MAGNVWEWRVVWMISNIPYRFDDGREDENASDNVVRVMRGGSYLNENWEVRCACRFDVNPVNRHDYFGFRVVVSLPNG